MKYPYLSFLSLGIIICLLACSTSSEKKQKTESNEHSTFESAPTVDRASDSHASTKDIQSPISKPALPNAPGAYFSKVKADVIHPPLSIDPKTSGSVVLIVIDALNANHLSAYGYERNTSPTIDQLAKNGVLFTNWISNSSWTRPSFTSIITGSSKAQHKVELTGQNLNSDITTMAEVFQKAGYRTAGFVGNPLVRKIWGFAQGFETYEDTKDHKAFPRARVLTDKAIKWLRTKKDQPFFLMVFYTDPHTPYRPPGEYRRYLDEIGATDNIQYPFKEYRKPLPQKDHNAIVAAYDGEIAYADSQIKRIVDQLKDMNRYDDTTIVITADHGEIFGEHNCYLHGYHQWEPVVRVPFIITSPSLPKGVVVDRPQTHIDLLPSLADLLELTLPPKKHGQSFATENIDPSRPLFSQYNAQGVRRQSTRIGNWKLIHHHKADRETVQKKMGGLSRNIPRAHPKDLVSIAYDEERWELYNLVEDPKELTNLYESTQTESIVEQLKQVIVQSDLETTPTKSVPQLSPDTIEALRAAGYIQ